MALGSHMNISNISGALHLQRYNHVISIKIKYVGKLNFALQLLWDYMANCHGADTQVIRIERDSLLWGCSQNFQVCRTSKPESRGKCGIVTGDFKLLLLEF